MEIATLHGGEQPWIEMEKKEEGRQARKSEKNKKKAVEEDGIRIEWGQRKARRSLMENVNQHGGGHSRSGEADHVVVVVQFAKLKMYNVIKWSCSRYLTKGVLGEMYSYGRE